MCARHHLSILLAACACRPEAAEEPVFDRTFAPLDVVKRCKNRTDHSSSTEDREIDALTIALTDGVHYVNPPTIGCELRAQVEGTRLRFRPQSCAKGAGEQSEIEGTAQFDAEGLLEIHLTSVEFWPPSPDLWPDGLWWDCGHDYLLEPLE
ncbi:MAG: hypothetical protein IPH07_36115 [Deltaproteobacteria bacterium]|nr:hypothetical protein [Deltaproteobacteria bacterium]MBK8235610.1 hypothetical protein [Deltaproteobacteria bacterium]MBK8713246.1 hypothetical protein [Deltaproteobacteria bacterium]MBP7288923.1 hypothetical protein [Nannocystaceae bacterium]